LTCAYRNLPEVSGFSPPPKSGHIEPSSLKKQHLNAIAEATHMLREVTKNEDAEFEGFEFYTLRHTCLTRWASHMDPWTLAYLAGHRDMNITKRYIHPQEQTIRAAMDRAQREGSGHTSGHTSQSEVTIPKSVSPEIIELEDVKWCARRDSNSRPTGSKPAALSN